MNRLRVRNDDPTQPSPDPRKVHYWTHRSIIDASRRWRSSATLRNHGASRPWTRAPPSPRFTRRQDFVSSTSDRYVRGVAQGTPPVQADMITGGSVSAVWWRRRRCHRRRRRCRHLRYRRRRQRRLHGRHALSLVGPATQLPRAAAPGTLPWPCEAGSRCVARQRRWMTARRPAVRPPPMRRRQPAARAVAPVAQSGSAYTLCAAYASYLWRGAAGARGRLGTPTARAHAPS